MSQATRVADLMDDRIVAFVDDHFSAGSKTVAPLHPDSPIVTRHRGLTGDHELGRNQNVVDPSRLVAIIITGLDRLIMQRGPGSGSILAVQFFRHRDGRDDAKLGPVADGHKAGSLPCSLLEAIEVGRSDLGAPQVAFHHDSCNLQGLPEFGRRADRLGENLHAIRSLDVDAQFSRDPIRGQIKVERRTERTPDGVVALRAGHDGLAGR